MDTEEITKPNFTIKNYPFSSYTPLKLLQLCSASDYEEIVEEWAYYYLKTKYEKVCKLGGPGDKGRDVAAYKDYKKGIWDCYQCKHYEGKLAPSDIWGEIGKLIYFCFKGDYSIPENYFFVCPLGISSFCNDILRNPSKLKDELLKNWDGKINLDSNLTAYINSFNFSIFNYIPPQQFIDQYSTTQTSQLGLV